MPLVLGDVRFPPGQFPHLVPKWLRGAARELRPTAPAPGRLERVQLVASLGRTQRPLVFRVAQMTSAFLL